jgi:hypothetical protein
VVVGSSEFFYTIRNEKIIINSLNILKNLEEGENEYQPHRVIIIALASIVIFGLWLQIDAIQYDYFVTRSRIESPGLTICFYSPYSKRWTVLLLGMLGIELACSILHERNWNFPKSTLYKAVLLSPIIIFVLDQIIMIKLIS